jgi:hypothetical protein
MHQDGWILQQYCCATSTSRSLQEGVDPPVIHQYCCTTFTSRSLQEVEVSTPKILTQAVHVVVTHHCCQARSSFISMQPYVQNLTQNRKQILT